MIRGWFLLRKLRRRVVILSTIWCGTTNTDSWRRSWQRTSRWDRRIAINQISPYRHRPVSLFLCGHMVPRYNRWWYRCHPRSTSFKTLVRIAQLINILRADGYTCQAWIWICTVFLLPFILKSQSDTDFIHEGSMLCAALGIKIFIFPVILICMASSDWSLFLGKFQVQMTIIGVAVLVYVQYVCL